MTNDQCRKKIELLRAEMNECIDKTIEKAIHSGAIDIEGTEDNFLVPKIILSAVLSEVSWHVGPMSDEGKKEVENLKLFL
jgi:hypothetical protein